MGEANSCDDVLQFSVSGSRGSTRVGHPPAARRLVYEKGSSPSTNRAAHDVRLMHKSASATLVQGDLSLVRMQSRYTPMQFRTACV